MSMSVSKVNLCGAFSQKNSKAQSLHTNAYAHCVRQTDKHSDQYRYDQQMLTFTVSDHVLINARFHDSRFASLIKLYLGYNKYVACPPVGLRNIL